MLQRRRQHGLNDLLSYALCIDDGVILLKQGAFMSGFSYRGPDMQSAGPTEMEWLTASVNHTLCQLGDGWMLHADLIRREICDYPDPQLSNFPDATSRLIDEERRAHYSKTGNHFDSFYTMVFTYLPPVDTQSKFQKFFLTGNDQQSNWEQPLLHFKNRFDQLHNSFSKYLTIEKLSNEQLISHIHSCITGLHHGILLSKQPVFLDSILSSQDFISGFYPKIGNHHIRVIGITGFPLEDEPGILNNLENLAIPFRWSNRFLFLDPLTANRQLTKFRRNWFQKRHGLWGLVKEIFQAQESAFQNNDALAMTYDVDEAMTEAESGLVRFGYFTSSIVLMNEDAQLLKQQTQLIIKTLENKGFSGRLEELNANEAYLGSLPGDGYNNIRKPLVHSLNLSDFIPLTSTWSGLLHNPNPYYPENSPPLLYAATTGNTPFRFNLHVNDVGHTAIFGDTGSGKSTLIGLLIAQHLRYKNAQVFLFDKGYSSYVLCKALGGIHFDLLSDELQHSFYPLSDIDDPNELNWACEWLEVVLESQHLVILPRHRKAIRDALTLLARQPHRTLTDFQSTVQDKSIQEAIEFYTLTGVMGTALDAQEDDFKKTSNSHVHLYEMKHLLERGEQFIKPILLYLFHRIEKQLAQHKPTLIIIEEGHAFLNGRFGQQINMWIREGRKQNAAIMFVTQNLTEVIKSEFKHIILNNCKTKIFLPNPEATSELNRNLYQHIGLTNQQIQLIAQATPKQDYYYTSPLGSRLINLDLGEIALSFIGQDGEEKRKNVDKLICEHNQEWVHFYLKQCELDDASQQWKAFYNELAIKNMERLSA